VIPYGTRVPAAVRLVANCYTPFTLPLPLHLPVKPFGHVAVADQAEDDSRALRAFLNPPGNWRRPRGRPRQSWLRTISDDPKHLNLGQLIVKRRIVLHGGKQLCSRSGRATR